MPITLSVRLFGQPKVSLILMQWSCVAKYCHMHAFLNFFLLFRVPPMSPSPTAPIHTDLCPSARMLDTFCLPAQNIMSGEISPTIWPKTMSCVPAYAHAYLVFLPARTHIPYRTHPHPCIHICADSHPQLQNIYVLFMLI